MNLSHGVISPHLTHSGEWKSTCTPLAVSKQGTRFFHDCKKRFFKYDPETDFLCCLSSDICVISPYVENLVSLPPSRCDLNQAPGSQLSSIFRRFKLLIPSILLTSTLVSLICFGYTTYKYRTWKTGSLFTSYCFKNIIKFQVLCPNPYFQINIYLYFSFLRSIKQVERSLSICKIRSACWSYQIHERNGVFSWCSLCASGSKDNVVCCRICQKERSFARLKLSCDPHTFLESRQLLGDFP